MDITYISTLSALAGSVVGGLASGMTTWMSLRSQARAGERVHNMSQREDLYRDFIVAASEIFGNAILSNDPRIQELVVLHGMISRMRVLSSSRVIDGAEKVVFAVIDAYSAPNRTIHELHASMRSKEIVDPLREFSEIARAELRAP